MDAEYTGCFHGFQRRIYVNDAVLRLWHEHRQTTPEKPEAFGALVGATALDKQDIWIEQASTPMVKDAQSRFRFALRDPGHQDIVDNAFRYSGGSRIYLGTWHTHPEPSPTPSNTDQTDWRRCLRRNKFRPLVFVIVGLDQTCLYIPRNRRFMRLTLGENR